MFANWERWRWEENNPTQFLNRPKSSLDWFYSNWKLVDSMAAEAGFVNQVDTLPAFRDTLLYAEKPR